MKRYLVIELPTDEEIAKGEQRREPGEISETPGARRQLL